MKRELGYTLLAIAGWYLIYPPVSHRGLPNCQASLSKWEIDGSYGTASDCDAAYHSDLSSMRGLDTDTDDAEDAHNAFLQTRAGRCIASDDPRLAE
jgi:hypothetical protein